jgi:hypothetical protein
MSKRMEFVPQSIAARTLMGSLNLDYGVGAGLVTPPSWQFCQRFIT